MLRYLELKNITHPPTKKVVLFFLRGVLRQKIKYVRLQTPDVCMNSVDFLPTLGGALLVPQGCAKIGHAGRN